VLEARLKLLALPLAERQPERQPERKVVAEIQLRAEPAITGALPRCDNVQPDTRLEEPAVPNVPARRGLQAELQAELLFSGIAHGERPPQADRRLDLPGRPAGPDARRIDSGPQQLCSERC